MMVDLPGTFVEGFHDEESVRKMKYEKLGRTGLMVSRLSLGGAAFSPFYGNVKEEDAVRVIHDAIKSGVNYIDTAPYYGQGRSEEIIGKALKGIPRQAFYIATKVGRYGGSSYEEQFDLSAKRTKESIEKSLNLLGLDYVDIIQIHDVEFAPSLDMVVNETLPAVEEAKKQGKLKFIGFSGYPLNVLKELILKAPGRFDTVLTYSRYTMLDDSLLEYLPFFLDEGLGVICAAVHGMGILTNAGAFYWHPANEETKQQGRSAGDYCKQHGVELGKLSTWYALQLEGPSTFLMGMPTQKVLHINLDSFHNGLSEKEREVLDYCLTNFCARKSNWEGTDLLRMKRQQSKTQI